jgi:FkbH-like protein
MSLVARARASLAKNRELPLGEVLEKVAANGAALISAPLYLRHCTRVGQRARTRGKPVIENLGTIEIGDDFQMNCAFSPVRLHAGAGAELRIGDGVNVNFGAEISATTKVTIGSRVSFGPYARVDDGVTLGDDVWLAARVHVKKDVTIGEGTVVTAGSVVETSLPPNVIAGGAPARVLKSRKPNGHAAPEQKLEEKERVAEVSGIVLADFTANDLARALEKDDALGPSIEAEVAPFDQVVQTLLQLSQPRSKPYDFAFVWTRPERVSPTFAKLLHGEVAPLDAILSEVDAFADVLGKVAGARFTFVATWTMPPHVRGLGMLDMRQGGIARALAAMNLHLAEKVEASSTTFVLDASRWMASDAPYNARLWYMGKVGWSRDVFDAATRDLRAALRGVRGHARKLLVLDLDDTLWGGIVGDQGWQNLRLGGHDPVGEALVDFQRAILALSKRGIALAVVSKNEESVALEAIKSHPEMIIKEEHLSGWRINWRDKAQNIAELVKELNLGLQSVVFIDDNPIERARVREALPEVLVPEWPEDKTRYVEAFHALGVFDVPRISQEDLERTKMYAQERQRETLKANVSSLDEWLDGLGTKVRFEPLGPANLPRTTQLLNKTNQMNLRTRRLSEAELMAWAKEPGHELWAVHVSDKMGDAGLTGILGLDASGDAVTIADYVLSCRVMGRRVEETLVWFATERARALGKKTLHAPYAKTPKNKPCLTFFEGLQPFNRDGDVFMWTGENPMPRPRSIDVQVEA